MTSTPATTRPAPGPFRTLADVKAANEATGQSWFSPDAMAFFNTRLSLRSAVVGGRFFITSDSPDDDPTTRRWSVRRAEDDGRVATVGEFRAYPSAEVARAAAHAWAAGDEDGATRLAQL